MGHIATLFARCENLNASGIEAASNGATDEAAIYFARAEMARKAAVRAWLTSLGLWRERKTT